MTDRVSPEDFLGRYALPNLAGVPKYVRLRESLLAAIEDGYWAPGDRLPNESALATGTDYSLGTIQKALGELVEYGAVVRLRGRGTFVARDHQPLEATLQFRFEDDAGGELENLAELVHRERGANGPWCERLGARAADVVRIDRVVHVGTQFRAYCRFFVDASRYPAFTELRDAELEQKSFKVLLRQRYRLRIASMDHRMSIVRFPAYVARAIGVPRGTHGVFLELLTMAAQSRPMFFQEGYIPRTERRLILPTEPPK